MWSGVTLGKLLCLTFVAKKLSQQRVCWGDHSRGVGWKLIEKSGDGGHSAALCLTQPVRCRQTRQVSRQRNSVQHLQPNRNMPMMSCTTHEEHRIDIYFTQVGVAYLVFLAPQASWVVHKHDFVGLQDSGNSSCDFCWVQHHRATSLVPPHRTNQRDGPTVQTPLKEAGVNSNWRRSAAGWRERKDEYMNTGVSEDAIEKKPKNEK